jgi:hypothetical protein
MTRTTALDSLFLVAGGISFTVDEILYRLTLIAIVLLLRALWLKAVIRRASRNGAMSALRGVDLHQVNESHTRSVDPAFGD